MFHPSLLLVDGDDGVDDGFDDGVGGGDGDGGAASQLVNLVRKTSDLFHLQLLQTRSFEFLISTCTHMPMIIIVLIK